MSEEPPSEPERPLLLFVISEDWFFASHFLAIATVGIGLGFEVAVATRVGAHAEAIRAAGVRVIAVNAPRNRLGPFAVWRQIRRLARLMREERPAIVHCIALRSIIIGGFAARSSGVPAVVLAVTGLGHLWVSRALGTAVARGIIRSLVRRLNRGNPTFLFENRDDPTALGLDPKRARIAYLPGAGVDPDAFAVVEEPGTTPVRVAVVSRMLWAKGIGTAVEAVRRMRRAGVEVELDLWGAPDPDNPASVPERQLIEWGREDGISWRGTTTDVATVWASSHIAVLASHYREGLPRSLVEAMASGRPIITTDVPGCRELVRDGVEGYVVPKEDPVALAEAIKRLVPDAALRRRMGVAARRRFEDGYTSAIVAKRIKDLYGALAPSE